METLYTYDESSKFYGKQFRLPYTGQTIKATSSQRRSRSGGKISDNYELENDGNDGRKRSIEKDQEEKRSKRRNLSTIDATDVDEESQLEDDSEIEDSLDFTKFEESFSAMDSEKMWRLKSGRKVEEIIHESAKELDKESHLHSFVINDIDKDAKSLFSEEEWKEIFCTDVKKKPKIESSLIELMKKYTLNSINDLREAIYQPFISEGIKFDRSLHYNLDFINYAYRGMLFLWEMENSFTSDTSKLEGWYQHNIWSRLIDPAFHDIDVELLRGESMSFASSDRKNEGKTVSNRKKIGRKGDGIFRITKDRMEFGAIETGRKWEGLNGSKYLRDSLKLGKMLKDMFTQLVVECDGKEDVIRKLQVIGILNGGNRLQTITMDTPRGYICRIQRGKVYEVDGRLSKSQPIAFVVKEILRTKAILLQTLDVINDNKLNNLFDDDDDDDVVDKPDQPRCSTPLFTLPKTFSTPHKSRTEDKLLRK